MLLVSGGTGMVGSAAVKELLSRGEKVAVLGRDANRIRAQFGSAVEPRVADVREPATLTAAMQGIETVVNAVQFPNSPIENKKRGWTFEKVDYEGTRNQIDAAKAAGVKRFVFVSGVGAAADARKHWFRFKWQAEQYLIGSGLEWVVVRPTWIYGPRDHSLNRILGFGKVLPFIPFFGDGRQSMQPVFIDDAGRVIADLATKAEAANTLFELGGPEVISMNDVIKTAGEISGRKRPILHQPMFLGKLAGTFASLLPSPPLSADAVDFIAAPAVADTRTLEQVLHPKFTPLREGLATYLKR